MQFARLHGFIMALILECLCLSCGGPPRNSLQPARRVLSPVASYGWRRSRRSPWTPSCPTTTGNQKLPYRLFDGLVRFDANLNTVAALAQDWKVAPDGRTYVFTLRQGVRFHHGREITAEDFVYSLTRLLDPKWKSNDAQYYAHILGAADFQAGRSATVSGLQALNASTLQIVLDEPYAPFLRLLAQQPASVVPKELVENSEHPFGQNPVGTGAFRLERWTPGTEILLAANPVYYAGRPYLERVRITTLPALNARESFQLFADGKLDVSFVPAEQATLAQSEPKWVFINRPVLRVMYLGMNVQDRLLRDPSVRKAVASAINKTELFGTDLDHAVIHGLLPASLLGSSPQGIQISYDPQSARDLLKRQHKHKPKIQLWHAQASQSRTTLLQRMASQLESVGFSVEIKNLSSMAELFSQIYARKTQLFLLGEQLDYPDPDALLNRLFRSTSPANPFGYSNSKVDALLLDAQRALDDKSRAGLYSQIESTIMRDYPALPLSVVKYSIACPCTRPGIASDAVGFSVFALAGSMAQA